MRFSYSHNKALTSFRQLTNPIVTQAQPRHRLFSRTSLRNNVTPIKTLPSWDVSTFRNEAFNPAVPAKLPHTKESVPPACSKWFIRDQPSSSSSTQNHDSTTSELRTEFWSEYKDTIVPLELTLNASRDKNNNNTDLNIDTTTSQTSDPEPEFQRISAPLSLLLTHLSQTSTHKPTTSTSNSPTSPPTLTKYLIYLAQHALPDLPPSLQKDLPTPALIHHAGRGDIYNSSLWLGRSPTYTPFHRDPNPNILLQIAGRKRIRLFPPDLGDAVFEFVLSRLHQRHASSTGSIGRFRGEEMMQGEEMRLLRDLVWNDCSDRPTEGDGREDGDGGGFVERYALETRLDVGEAVFIPKGWWHSVLGVGDGVTASVNWWFR